MWALRFGSEGTKAIVFVPLVLIALPTEAADHRQLKMCRKMPSQHTKKSDSGDFAVILTNLPLFPRDS